jgi:hypothetical protein
MNPEALVAWITIPMCILGAIGAAVFGDAGIVLDVLAGGGLGAIIGQAINAFGSPRADGRAAQIVGRLDGDRRWRCAPDQRVRRGTMSPMKGFARALSVAAAVALVGVLVFQALEIGGLAWWALLLVAMFAGSLVDRDHFYGPRTPETHA